MNIKYTGIKKIVMIILVSTVFFLVVPLSAAEWTIMMYIAADNDLAGYAADIFNELSETGSTNEVNIVALYDRTGDMDWNDTRRGIINKNDVQANWGYSLGELNTADPETLTDFVNRTMLNYPATRYALIINDHGTGWQPGLNYDNSSATGDNMTMSQEELRSSLQNVFNLNGIKIDFLGFHACLMGMIEVAYQVKDFCNYMLASEEIQRSWKWDYKGFLGALSINPAMNPVELGTLITKLNLIKTGQGDNTLIDLSKINDLAINVDSLALTLESDWFNNPEACVAAAGNVMAGIKSAVVAQTCTGQVYGSNGLSIYFPKISEVLLPEYSGAITLFTNVFGWDEFLTNFHSNMEETWIEQAKNQTQHYAVMYVSEGQRDFSTHTDLYDFCRNLSGCVPGDLEITETEDIFMRKKLFAYNDVNPVGFYTLFNSGPAPVGFAASVDKSWLSVSPVSGVLNPGEQLAVSINVNRELNYFDKGVQVGTASFKNTLTGTTRIRDIAVHVPHLDKFVEEFHSKPVDFKNTTFMYVADPENNYTVWKSKAVRLPVDPLQGEVLDLAANYSEQIELTGNHKVSLYGTDYGSLYISRYGCINFADPDDAIWWPMNVMYFVIQPRVGGLADVLNPSLGGTITCNEMADRLVVSYVDVPAYSSDKKNTFQIEMFYNGRIRITYLDINAEKPVIGITNGDGIYDDLYKWHGESNFNCYFNLGDVNANEMVDIIDALMIAQYSVGLTPPTFYTHAADANGDSVLNIIDALITAQYYVGLLEAFPAQVN